MPGANYVHLSLALPVGSETCHRGSLYTGELGQHRLPGLACWLVWELFYRDAGSVNQMSSEDNALPARG